MNSVIKVESVGKKYLLGTKKNNKFKTLRDSIATGFNELRNKDKTDVKTEFWALNDITFDIQQGDRIGIIGRNGAGKSTLLKILSRVVYPSHGRLILNGRVASLLEVGTGFHPELTGRENIYLNGAILGMSKREIKKKFDEIVYFSDVEKFLDTPVKRYSSGMYVRLAFSVAAHLESDVLIVDEVLAVGDTEFQNKCLGKMSEVSTSGRTVIFVSHNLQTIKKLCTNSIVLNKGNLLFNGKTEEAIELYMKQSNKKETYLKSPQRKEFSNKISFCEIKTLKKNAVADKFSLGDDITVLLNYKIVENVKSYYISIELWTEDGVKLSNIVSFDSNFYPNSFSPNKKISVDLNDFRFYPGIYYLNIWVGDSITHETYDYVFNAASFEIIDGGSLVDRQLSKETGLILLTPKWTELGV